MTAPLVSQGCYTSAMGSLDWLDTSYSPMQLIEKYKLPTLVRICEGYYGNTSNSCFSAMDVIKMHEVQRVDMILTKVAGSDSKCPDSPEPTRVCFPKNFDGRFDPIHQAGDKLPKCLKGVNKLAEQTPHFVRVKKRPGKKGEGPDKDDILEILGLAMCESWREERGFLRCRRQDGEEILLSLRWGGLYEVIPDPEGYTLQDLLKRFVLPCKVTLRNPESHLHPESDLIKLLPQLEDTLVLEREITHEFLVGTAVDVGALAQQPSGSGKAKSSRHRTAAVPWVVLTKNANVLFQICQDMVHKRATYLSLLEMFGDCCIDKIPMELFICEYAAPFVAFARVDDEVAKQPRSNLEQMTGKPPHSRSAPDLSQGCEDDEVWDCDANGFGCLRVDPEVAKRMTDRKLPPLPPEASPNPLDFIDILIKNPASPVPWTRVGTLPPNIHNINKPQPMQDAMIKAMADSFRMGSTTEAKDAEDVNDDCAPYTNPIETMGRVVEPITRALPILPHPDPPLGFCQQPGYTEMEEIRSAVGNAGSHDAPPSRKPPPPPPPPRTTPSTKSMDTVGMYGNLGGESDPPGTSCLEPTARKSSPPATPHRPAPPAPKPRKISTDKAVVKRGSRSFNEVSRIRHQSPTRRMDEMPWLIGRPTSLFSSEYLRPRQPTSQTLKSGLNASSKSRSTGTLLEEMESTDSSSSDASKGCTLQAPDAFVTTPNRPITPCKPTRRILQMHHIPADISTLTSVELAQCLRLLKLDEEVVGRCRNHQINGSLLVQLTSQTVRNELALTDFEAEKVDAFRKGWRPDEEN